MRNGPHPVQSSIISDSNFNSNNLIFIIVFQLSFCSLVSNNSQNSLCTPECTQPTETGKNGYGEQMNDGGRCFRRTSTSWYACRVSGKTDERQTFVAIRKRYKSSTNHFRINTKRYVYVADFLNDSTLWGTQYEQNSSFSWILSLCTEAALCIPCSAQTG